MKKTREVGLVRRGYNPRFGARPMKQIITKHLGNALKHALKKNLNNAKPNLWEKNKGEQLTSKIFSQDLPSGEGRVIVIADGSGLEITDSF